MGSLPLTFQDARPGGWAVAMAESEGAARLPSLLGARPSSGRVVLAVNVGGCIVPVVIASYEIGRLSRIGVDALGASGLALAANVWICYRLARPVPGLGIALPALVSPAVAALSALLLAPDEAPPVAFIAGTLGPLIGADLLHLRDIRRIAVGVASIGGAGTFDGIVLGGLIATLLA